MSEKPVRTFFMMPRPQIAVDLMSTGEVVIQVWQMNDEGTQETSHITLEHDSARELAEGILDLLKDPKDQ